MRACARACVHTHMHIYTNKGEYLCMQITEHTCMLVYLFVKQSTAGLRDQAGPEP